MWRTLLDTLPRGYTLEEHDWLRRHRLLLRLLAAHVPGLALLGFLLGSPWTAVAWAMGVPVLCVLAGWPLRQHRRTASVLVTLGLVWCSGALVGLSGGAIEAHFHFFIIIGFIALYQDWAPVLCNIAFVVISHGVGSVWQRSLIFSHPEGQQDPWLWSLIHGVAVLFACVGMMLFWRFTEESQQKGALARQLADAEIGRRQFTSNLLVNLARRNQSLLYRQLDIINQLEETERDPDALAELFTLDHLATRVRRNAESLLVLSGEQSPRTWSGPVPLRDVLRASIAETENLDRVVFVVDEQSAVVGHCVTDLTHLLAELTENAVRFSPPDTVVTIRARADRNEPGAQVLTIEDWGVGMAPDELAAANELLADPPEIDLSVSQRLGLHVIARLAARHAIRVSLGPTPGSGITAVVALPVQLFGPAGLLTLSGGSRHAEPVLRGVELPHRVVDPTTHGSATNGSATNGSATNGSATNGSATNGTATVLTRDASPERGPFGSDGPWTGWWQPEPGEAPAPADVPQWIAPPATSSTFPATSSTFPASTVGPAAPAGPPPEDASSDPDLVPPVHLTTPLRPTPQPATPVSAPPPPPARATATPSPRPQQAGDRPAGDHLRRRVPQSHLAPGLRASLPAAEIVAEPPHVSDPGALSRYQAGRRAARDVAENGGPA